MAGEMSRVEIETTAARLAAQAERLAAQQPKWAWSLSNLRLTKSLLALVQLDHPDARATAELRSDYLNEVRRCKGVPDWAFLECLRSIDKPAPPRLSRPPTGIITLQNFKYLPQWMQISWWVLLAIFVPIVGAAFPRYARHSLLPPRYRYIIAAVTFAVLMPFWLMIRRATMQIYNRRQRGECIYCGYDLRATPDRCPECGMPPS